MVDTIRHLMFTIVARFAFRNFWYSSVIYLKIKDLIEVVILFMLIHISLWLELPIFDPKSGHCMIHVKHTLLIPKQGFERLNSKQNICHILGKLIEV